MSAPDAPPSHGVVEVGPRRFDFGTLSFDDGQRLSPKAAHVLWLLLCEAGRTVSKDSLLDTVWAGRFRVPDVLVQAIGEIRRGLGDGDRDGAVLTVPKVGYRLQCEVRWLDGDGPAPAAPDRAAAAAATSSWHGWRLALLVSVLALALALLAWRADRGTEPPAQSNSPAATPALPRVEKLRRVAAEAGADTQPAPSPDARVLAYARKNAEGWYRIHLRVLDGSPARELDREGPGDDVRPAWSTDGSRIAFQRFRPGTCHYVVHELASGASRVVGGCFADFSTPVAWIDDDRALLITDRVESRLPYLHLVRLDLDDGSLRLLDYAREPDRTDYAPRLSPDGRELAFLRLGSHGAELMLHRFGELAVRSAGDIEGGVLGFDWLADGDGWLVSARPGAVPVLARLDREGRFEPLDAPPLQRPVRAPGGDWFAEEVRLGTTIERLDADGGSEPLTRGSGEDHYPTPAADGRLLFVSSRSGHPELWLQSGAGEGARQLTDRRAGSIGRPHWDDSGGIRYTQVVDGRWQAWRLDPQGGPPQPLAQGPYELVELVPAGGRLFAIGGPAGESSAGELLRLLPEAADWRVEPTGIPALSARGDPGSLWIRQRLRRGARELDPESLAFTGRELGEHHFLDWLVEADGLLHWAAVDALRTELRFLPFDGGPGRVVLPGDDAYAVSGGLARDASGRLLYARLHSAESDIVSFRLSPPSP